MFSDNIVTNNLCNTVGVTREVSGNRTGSQVLNSIFIPSSLHGKLSPILLVVISIVPQIFTCVLKGFRYNASLSMIHSLFLSIADI